LGEGFHGGVAAAGVGAGATGSTPSSSPMR
jgi:hypothetical protein